MNHEGLRITHGKSPGLQSHQHAIHADPGFSAILCSRIPLSKSHQHGIHQDRLFLAVCLPDFAGLPFRKRHKYTYNQYAV
jgi:hypothetical protein